MEIASSSALDEKLDTYSALTARARSSSPLHTLYHLRSVRVPNSPSRGISLLVWRAIQEGLDRMTFDRDGFSGLATFSLLNGFGGTLKQRLGGERLSRVYALARALKRSVVSKSDQAFSPNL